MKIKKLFQKIPHKAIKGPKEIKITGLASDAKTVAPGNLFLAKKGKNFDGADFIAEAVAAGAAAVVSDFYNPFFKQLAQIIHDDAGSIEAEIAATYYGFPSRKLFVAGVTGTNGKTTTAYLIRHFLEQNQKPT
ncbi:MAG: Mur ligase domain-containing protein, partial [Parachlamydiales bacterium]